MNKTLLKNPWVLAGLHLLITIIIGLLLSLVKGWLDVKFSGGLAALLAAFTIGQIYTFKFRELIGKKLRLKVSSIAMVIQFVLGILLGLSLSLARKEWAMYLVTLVIITVAVFFGIYFALRIGGKNYLKIVERQGR